MLKSKIFLSTVLSLLTAAGLFAQSPSDPAETNISFKGADNVTLKGYLALPAGKGPFPAILMIHEWWGLNRDVALLTDALAAQGYVVLAADAFRGSVARTRADALKQVQSTPPQQIAADLDKAVDYLRSRSDVDPDRVAVLGFCFGGTQAMYMGTRNTKVSAVVIFYGSGPISDPEALGSMNQAGPVLGIYGEEDGNIPLEQVEAFRKALTERGIDHTITVYSGVGHAFVKSGTYNNGAQAENAWKQMVEFLRDNL
jgi:carboxymethylenebutenolidase